MVGTEKETRQSEGVVHRAEECVGFDLKQSRVHRAGVSSWILMSHQLHRVSSG